MASNEELRKIKKRYGEKFMHMCRDLFPTILEKEGLLLSILEKTFADNSRSLYDSIHDNDLEINFRSFIYSKIDPEVKIEEVEEKSPYELLDEAGYELYECTSEEDIQKFRKYYEKREELCTFFDKRLDRCVVFFAIKKNVEEIKREDFKSPKREDEYGTSVMSIQFNKYGTCTVSIKNRYNHTVTNPDATYGNNLDKIILGLSQSFKILLEKRGLQLDTRNIEEFGIPGYVMAGDGRYYKYNFEINGSYYCPGNIIIGFGEITKLGNPEKELLIDHFILDLENKCIKQYDTIFCRDAFLDGLQDIERIEIVRDKEAGNGGKIIRIKRKNSEAKIEIRIDKDNQIIGYINEEIQEIGSNFLTENRKLSQLSLPRVIGIEDSFLDENTALKQLKLPSLLFAGDDFLYANQTLEELELPKLRQTGESFLYSNLGLKYLSLPVLEQVKDEFLGENTKIRELKLPKLKIVGSRFLQSNQDLTKLELSELQEVGDRFLYRNKGLEQVHLGNLIKVGHSFLDENVGLEALELLKLEEAGSYFLEENRRLSRIELPKLKQVDNYFLSKNVSLVSLKLLSLEKVGNDFLRANKNLAELELPRIKYIGSDFLFCNTELISLNFPNLLEVGNRFLQNNRKLRVLKLPKVKQVGNRFLSTNNSLVSIKIPKLKIVGSEFFSMVSDVSPRTLARLDRENNLTTDEVTRAQIIIARLKIFWRIFNR